MMVITFLITSLRKCMSASSLEGQVYFKKIRNYGKRRYIYLKKQMLQQVYVQDADKVHIFPDNFKSF